jgi:nitrogen regulatory protein P-II 1
MKKLDIITRPDSLEKLKVLLERFSVGGITVTTVMGCGIQKGDTSGELQGLKIPGMNLIPKIQATIVVEDKACEEILNTIHEDLSTGKVGDGKVFVTNVEGVMRIRTGERDSKAI